MILKKFKNDETASQESNIDCTIGIINTMAKIFIDLLLLLYFCTDGVLKLLMKRRQNVDNCITSWNNAYKCGYLLPNSHN